MKIFKYGLPFAALALLASCSNDNIDVPNGDEQTPVVSEDGKMYAAITIQMSSTMGTKAPTYADGKDEEYAAKSGNIYLFEKPSGNASATEDEYTYVTSAPLASLSWDKDSDHANTGITTSATTATAMFEASAIADDTEYYGLIILNEPTGFPSPSGTVTFGTWKKTAHGVGLEGSLANGFVMTNAPGSTDDINTEEGDEQNLPVTLVPITAANFHTTLQAAMTDDSKPSFYVQREVAKVSLSVKSGESLGKFAVTMVDEIEDESGAQDYVKFTAWDLNTTNNSTYPVQVVNDFTTWVGYGLSTGSPFYATNGTFHRVYWAEDPNYNGADGTYSNLEGQTSVFKTIDDVETQLSVEAFYPLENTMAAKYQTKGQSTSVILKGTYYVNPTLVNGTDLPADASSFIVYGVKKYKLDGISLVDGATSGAGKTLSSLFSSEKGSADKSPLQTIMDKMNITDSNVEVDLYLNGVVYYQIMIRHFEDDELNDWDKDEWKSNGENGYEYKNDWTGRFGVVRNNWYDVNINSISGVGDPTIPEIIPGDPDDPKENKLYISAKINILDWAKRSHQYDL